MAKWPARRAARPKARNPTFRHAYRSVRKYGRTKTKRPTRSRFSVKNISTAQRDVIRERTPRKRYTNPRFTKKVEEVESRKQGKITLVYTNQLSSGSSANTQQFDGFTLFGKYGTSPKNDDLFHLLGYYDDTLDDIPLTSKNLYILYGVLELSMACQTGSNIQFLDIYEWKTRRNCITAASIDDVFFKEYALEEMPEVPAIGLATISINTIGVTPFHLPAVCKSIKFTKHTKVQIPKDGVVTYKMIRKKNRYVSGTSIINTTTALDFAKYGWTEGIIVLHRGKPAAASLAEGGTINYSITRSYAFRSADPHGKNLYDFETR
jgi:hypothetical protein